jgi:putative transposase
MSRSARVIPVQGYLHVISRGNNHQRLFRCRKDYKIYCLQLRKLKIEESVKIHHYCLMPNHVHLLVGVDQTSNLARFMKRVGLKYFYYYLKKRDYSGHLLQGRFKSKIIDNERYFLQCGKYIELNPVRARIVDAPADYYFSSYRYYALGQKDGIVDADLLYLDLHEDAQRRRKAYCNMLIDEKGCSEELRINLPNLLLSRTLET